MFHSGSYFRYVAVMLAFMLAGPATAQSDGDDAPEAPKAALEKLHGDVVRGGEWRTPNPDYKAGEEAPTHYVLRYNWGPYKQHITGELGGIYQTEKGEKEIRYWTMYTFYNPITRVAEASQIGWNGSIGIGPMHRNIDGNLQIDQVFYGVDGSKKDVRHIEKVDKSGDWFVSSVFEKDAADNWVKGRDWIWTKHISGANNADE